MPRPPTRTLTCATAALAAALALAGTSAYAQQQGVREKGPPQVRTAPSPAPASKERGDRELPVVVEAQSIRGRPDLETVAEGDAELRRGDVTIRADRLSYDQVDDLARAIGGVRVTQDGNVFTGSELQLRLQSYEGWFLAPTYFFSRLGAGGKAARIDFVGADRARLAEATYSSCRPDGDGAPAWLLSSDRVSLDLEANEGVAEGAVLRFYGVPILAAPVLSFPLTDARKSGWLPPSINLDSKSGLQLAVPYYWNIAPQRDATITPSVITRRGAGVETEFRYLEPTYRGAIDYALLPFDQEAGRSRHALAFDHEGAAAWAIDYRARVRRVSDDAYWKDFPRAIDTLTPRLLPVDVRAARPFTLAGADWTAYARVEQWQVLQDPDPAAQILTPYERSPQLGVRGRGAWNGLAWAIEGEYDRFTLPADNTDPTRPRGERTHLIGSAAWPVGSPGWTLTPRLAFNAAQYALDEPFAGRRSPSRVIPTFSLDSAWVLERDARWFGRDVRQTLEPRLLYVRTPFRDQSNTPIFDTAARDFNFESIFSDNDFVGVDRVSDADELTAGATTRLLDPATGAEAVRLGIAQRYRFRQQRITAVGAGTDPTATTSNTSAAGFSDLLLGAATSLVPRWSLEGSLQYNPDTHRTIRSLLSARYSPGPFRTVSASYRFTRDFAEQVEVGWQWPIYRSAAPQARLLVPERNSPGQCAGTWYGVGRINYSVRETRLTDAIVGFEYDAGCWIGRVVAERRSTGLSDAATRLLLQLELVGLSRLGSNPLKVLKDNIPGYRLLREDSSAPFASSPP